MTELEHKTIKPLINDNTIKFYGTYFNAHIYCTYVDVVDIN